MKLWSRLCLLVLVSSVCRGQKDGGTGPEPTQKPSGPVTSPAPGTENTPGTPQDATVVLQSNSTQNETAGTPRPTTNQTEDGTTVGPRGSGEEDRGDESEGNTVYTTMVTTVTTDSTVTTATTATTVTTVTTCSADVMTTGSSGSPAETPGWAYVVMTLIFIAIFILCVILYFLRRASRTYSFDLQRPAPVRLNEPTGTFELYLDDLESPPPGDHVTSDDLSPPPLTNGTTPLEETCVKGEKAPLEQPGSNGVDSSSSFFPSAGDEAAAERRSEPGDTNLLCEAAEEQNENNNNPAVCSNDPFVEINLEDPAWCDQLLTSPEAPSSSSVLPFSPFSFSSSSSSSS